MERVIAYIDGFNLYFGLKDSGWRRYYWLNLQSLVRNLLKPEQKVKAVKYFTARVSQPPDKKLGGEKFHARYLLANVGGFRYETGLDEGNAGETTDVSILDGVLYEKRWRDFQKETAAYDFADEVEVEGVLV